MKASTLIPIIAVLVAMGLIVLRNRAPRVLHPERLWIMPAIVLPLIGLGLWGSQYEPGASHVAFGPAGWGLLALGLALGAAFGWQRGRMVVIQRTPEGVLKAQASPLAVMLIVLVFVTRSALRPWTEAHAADWHVSPLAIGDAFLMFVVGMIVAQRIEMYLRARHIQRGEPDAHVEAVA
ncbi:MAG: DUF1453 family protein [Brevundimonas sp.]|nr:MAG: DUF1453 family protein [Brevundimonas sp.]